MNDLINAIPQVDGYSNHDPRHVVSDLSTYAINGYTSSGSITSEPIYVGNASGYSVYVSCPDTGSPEGTVKLQGCLDKEKTPGKSDRRQVNWFDVAELGNRITSEDISGASSLELTDPHCMYRWFRVVYTRTSGSITLTLKVQTKGEQ